MVPGQGLPQGQTNVKKPCPFTSKKYMSVYLPKGSSWYSWNGRNRFAGGSKVEIEVGADSIPLFVRGRSVVPLAFQFGNKGKYEALDANKQRITGLYVKIAYDTDEE